MSTTNGSPSTHEAVEQKQSRAEVKGKKSRLRHTPGGVGLGKDAGQEAQRLAAAILEVLAGLRTPGQAAEALGISQARYFQVETRAMQALVASCVPRSRGPGRNPEREIAVLKRQQEHLKREVSRQQTLLRLAQRNIGLAPPRPAGNPSSGKEKSKKRRRKPVVRALRAAEVLQRRSEEVPNSEVPGQEAVAEVKDKA